MTHRYAIFYAPPKDSPLERFGMNWLGRDHRTGAALPQPTLSGMAPERLAALTAAPRRYGFHGTLKAPFRLAKGCDGAGLHDAVITFTRGREPFILPPLKLADLNGFLALVPSLIAPPLDDLAAACVRTFEPCRAPLSAAEMQRRRPERLNERQLRQLQTFGYPWIFDDFAFHLTLTDRLDAAGKAILVPALQERTAPLATKPFTVDAVAVFEEPAPGEPFVMTGRYPFTAAG